MTGAAIAAEWVKLRSLRSTLLAFGVVVLTGGLTLWLIQSQVGAWDSRSSEQPAQAQASRAGAEIPWIGETTFTLAYLALAVTGTLAASSEYATGMARTSLLATPRRMRWLLAKVTTIAGFSLTAGAVVLVPTAVIAASIVGDRELPPPYVIGDGLSDVVAWSLAGTLVAAVTGLVGLGVGLVLRSTAAAVTVSAGLLVVPGVVAVTLPASVASTVMTLQLPHLGSQLVGTPHAAGDLSSLQAVGVLAGYLVVALGTGAAMVHRRDA